MQRIVKFVEQLHLALSKRGLGYVLGRIPSMLFWSTICTGLLIGGQFLFYSLMPATYFAKYDEVGKVSDAKLGEKPVLKYCRFSRDTYPVIITAQVRKVEPPVYVQQYKLDGSIARGQQCFSRELSQTPQLPGEYKVFYNVEIELPFGVKKYTQFETEAFKVDVPSNIYGSYELTILEQYTPPDGKVIYKVGDNLQYKFKAEQLVETFGTTERHIVCGDKDYFIDSYSGRNLPGERDTLNKTATVPEGAAGQCILELRLAFTVAGSTSTVAQTLRSNTFVVQ
jgi:hypothetical protein